MVALCRGCGSGSLYPMPSESEIRSTYDDAYLTGASDFYRGRCYYDAREQAIKEGTVTGFREILTEVDLRGKRHLDVGCASGALLVLSRGAGAHVTGVEPNESAASYGKERYGLDIRQGDLLTASLAAESFDLVTAVDVMEHLGNPLGFMREVARILRPGGAFMAITPNFRCGRSLGTLWIGLRSNMEHVVYFTPESFSYLARGVGLVPGKRRTRGFPLALGGTCSGDAGRAAAAPHSWSARAVRALPRPVRRLIRWGVVTLFESCHLGHDLEVWARKING